MRKRDVGGSSSFRVFETEEFQRSLGKLPPLDARFIRRKLNERVYPQLRGEPYLGPNIKKLRWYSPDTWRYRIGRFRVFYGIDEAERTVFILSVDWRRDAYRW